MTLKFIVLLFCLHLTDALVINNNNNQISDTENDYKYNIDENNTEIYINNSKEDNANQVFDGVYSECFLRLSYWCLQKKTLLYLKELDKLQEVSVIGDYVKFVKVNDTSIEDINPDSTDHSEELSAKIDEAVDIFFNNHILKFRAMGRDVAMPNSVDEFVGRKRKGGGGGGGGHGGGGHGHDDGGKKKMMMMAMMCMKMKFMMMVPAMLGMMGMMSFKGMMFSMMSFMMAKMMLLMKILEKKGMGMGGGGGGGGWNDGGGWAAGGGSGGGGAWMPAGGQDYGGGGGGGGGYDANGQWQSRSIIDTSEEPIFGPGSDSDAEDPVYGVTPTHGGVSSGFTPKDAVEEKEELELTKPIITYVKPVISYNNKVNGKKPFSTLKKLRDEVIKVKHIKESTKVKSRKKRGIVDLLQNAYLYWINKVLSLNSHSKYTPRYPKFKLINGIKYVYYPIRHVQTPKMPKDLKPLPQATANIITGANIINTEMEDAFKPIVAAENFNKGEIVEGPVEARMTKKLKDFKDTLNEAMEDSPWQ